MKKLAEDYAKDAVAPLVPLFRLSQTERDCLASQLALAFAEGYGAGLDRMEVLLRGKVA